MTQVVHRRELEPGIHLLELDRPDRLNAMTENLVEQLHEQLSLLATDDSCRVVILTGRGRGFCAGLDLKGYTEEPGNGLPGYSPQDRMRLIKRIASLVTELRSLPQPVIAAINGAAAGGGLALAVASDVRLAGASAKFADGFVRIGLSGCEIGVSWLLPRLIGASRAFELMLTGRLIDAAEADRIGLVSRVVPDDELLSEALSVAREITGNSPFGVRLTKQVMWHQLETGSLGAGIAMEAGTQATASLTADAGEALTAFLEDRQPRFTDS